MALAFRLRFHRMVMVLRSERSNFPKLSKEVKRMLFLLLLTLNLSGAEIGRREFLIQQIPKADSLLTEKHGSKVADHVLGLDPNEIPHFFLQNQARIQVLGLNLTDTSS